MAFLLLASVELGPREFICPSQPRNPSETVRSKLTHVTVGLDDIFFLPSV